MNRYFLLYFLPYFVYIVYTDNIDWHTRYLLLAYDLNFSLTAEPALHYLALIFSKFSDKEVLASLVMASFIIYSTNRAVNKLGINSIGKIVIIFNPISFYFITNVQGQAIASITVIATIYKIHRWRFTLLSPFFHVVGLIALGISLIRILKELRMSSIFSLLLIFIALYYYFFNPINIYIQALLFSLAEKVDAYQHYNSSVLSIIFHIIITTITTITIFFRINKFNFPMLLMILLNILLIIYGGKLAQRILLTTSYIMIFYIVTHYKIFKGELIIKRNKNAKP